MTQLTPPPGAPGADNSPTPDQQKQIAIELCERVMEARRAVVSAQSVLDDLSAELASLECIAKAEEGSTTTKLDGFKVVTTQNVYRRVDQDKWAEIEEKVPADWRPVKTKVEPVAAKCKALANSDDETTKQWWAYIAQAITTKPGKLSVKVEEA
jgi:hypothetical protein